MAGTQKNIAVFGAGSWGTALALLLARNGHQVTLWGHDAAHMATVAHEGENHTYLPGIKFPENLKTSDDLAQTASNTANWLVVVPSHAFRVTVAALAPYVAKDTVLAWATKGLEPDTNQLLSNIVDELCPGTAAGVVSGPTFAKEVAKGLPTALAVAAIDSATADEIADWMRSDTVRVYTNSDVVGVQMGGAIKNVMAIAAGISDGLGYGANARAALITRGLAELTRLGVAMGGHAETFMGLTGVGDLVLTCTDNLSRNRQVGLGLGKGKALAEILAELGQEAEGVSTAREVHRLADKMGVDMPITEQVYRVLYDSVPPQQAVGALLQRDPRAE
ncbi:MAG: NAD(P)-dependent glycerol-3-phosphate dehydrogenase [Proteobacteria bacterium]|nr:NAD(P)-dependent glycerol-3-phosphate dehydrogenase [Pseudomonadota bacterium]